jgi:hypothetical protein
MSRNRTRRMSPDRLRRHRAGIRRLDAAFGAETSGRSLSAERKLGLLERLGFGYTTKARDDA